MKMLLHDKELTKEFN